MRSLTILAGAFLFFTSDVFFADETKTRLFPSFEELVRRIAEVEVTINTLKGYEHQSDDSVLRNVHRDLIAVTLPTLAEDLHTYLGSNSGTQVRAGILVRRWSEILELGYQTRTLLREVVEDSNRESLHRVISTGVQARLQARINCAAIIRMLATMKTQ